MADRKIAIRITLEGAERSSSRLKSLNGKIENLNKSMKKTSTQSKKAEKSMKGFVGSIAKGIIVARGFAIAVGAVNSAVSFGVKQAANYELSVAKISAITQATGKSLEAMEASIRGIAAVSPRTAAEVANTALSMSKLGLSSQEVQDALEGVVGLSVALDEDVQSVGETLVSVKNVFQKEASELTAISNQLFTGFAKSALNLDKFSTAFSFAGGTAKLAGASITEMTAAMGILASSGIRASTIGTQLRKMFLELSIVGSKASKAIGNETIESIGLEEALRRLAPVVEDAGEAKRLFGLRAVSVAQILTSNIDKYKELNTEITNTKDVIQDASDIIKQTLIGELKKLESAWTNLFISISKDVFPIMKVGVEGVTGAIKFMNKGLSNTAAIIQPLTFLAGGWIGVLMNMGEETKKTAKEISNLGPQLDPFIEFMRNAEQGPEEGNLLLKQIKGFKEFSDAQAKLKKQKAEEDLILQEKNAAKKAELDKKLAEEAFEEQIRIFAEESDLEDDLKAKKLKKDDELAKKALQQRIDTAQEELDLMFDLFEMENAEELRRIEFKEEMLERERLIHEQRKQFALDGTQSILRNLQTTFRGMKQFSGLFKALAITDTIISTFRTAQQQFESWSKTFPGPIGTGLGVAAAAAATTAGLARVNQIRQAASGYDGQVSTPTMFMAGEAGAERVSITPRSKINQTSTEGGMVVHIHGDVFGEEQFIEKVNNANQEIGRRSVNV